MLLQVGIVGLLNIGLRMRCDTVCVQNDDVISQTAHEQIIVALTPLLENNHPTQEICSFFTKVLWPNRPCILYTCAASSFHCKVSFRHL